MRHLLLAIALVSGSQAAPLQNRDHASDVGALGIAAYERGEHSAALSLLRSAIHAALGQTGLPDGIDPWSAVYLSRMYLLGEGTPQDVPLACALFRAALLASDRQTSDVNAAHKFRRVIGQDPCITGSAAFDTEVQFLLSGCFLGGISKMQFDMQNASVLVDRTGIHIESSGSRVDQPLPFASNCEREALALSLVSVEPHAAVSGAATRYFISVFTRGLGRNSGRETRELRWYMVAVDTKGAKVVAMESLGPVAFEPCPGLDCATWLAQTVVAEARPDMTIRWTLLAFNRSGLIAE